MFSTKNIIKISRKSQEMATNSITKVEKGHFVGYTLDGQRFVFPLKHLKTYIFRELLSISEEEFGLPSNGPITFPCDASFMKDAANLIYERASLAKERALLQSLVIKT
ncbi:putative small auxin-up RNA [Helianthus annuus]|nr:putative small auxin-up RNA [Helianthus annuus]